MNKTKLAALAFGLIVLAGLSLPVSNLLFKDREEILLTRKDTNFKLVSTTLQNKCADCHTPGLSKYPIYYKFPIADTIISEDIERAQEALQISKEQLSGRKPFDKVQLVKMKYVVQAGDMPPFRYVAMHWDANLSADEASQILEFIKNEGAGIKPIPAENPFNPDEKKVALGKRLYFEKRLSGDNTVSCASCHALDKGGTDQAVVSTGIHGQKGPINSPTVFNAAFNHAQFWDGRAADLEEQAAGPINNPLEMGSNWKQAIGKLEKDPSYVKDFAEVYPDGITDKAITNAIAEYEKTLLTPDSRFDQFLNGDDKAITAEEKEGYDLFLTNNCATCHTGVNLGGLTYEKMGVRKDYFALRGTKVNEADMGRFNVTKLPADKHKFKVPTLRNVDLTYPYFHDGSAKSLDQAVSIMAEVQTGKRLTKSEVTKIVKFLKTLKGKYQDKSL